MPSSQPPPDAGVTTAGEAPPPGPFRVRSLLRDTPTVVWGVTALHVVLLVVYSVVVPTFRAPDEEVHVDLVLLVRDQLAGEEPLTWPAVTERQIADRVNAALLYLRFDDGPHRKTVGEADVRGARPSFAELGTAEEVPELDHNQAVQHPPTYYALAAAWLALPPGSDGWPFDRQVAYLRLLSVLLLSPVPLLAYAAARLLSGQRRVALAAAVAALAVPQFTYMGAVVNNDSLLVLAGSVLTLPLLHAARGDRSLTTGAWAGLALGVALATKGLAFALVPWVGAAYLLGWWRTRGGPPWRPLLLAGAVTALLAAWWWVQKVLTVGSLHVRGTVYPTDPDVVPEPLRWVAHAFVPQILETWWGSFVWADAVLPYPWVLLPAALLLAGVAGAFAVRGQRLEAALLCLPSLLLLGLSAWASYTTYARTGLAMGIQGRYLFPGLVGLLAVVAHGYGALLAGHDRWLPAGVLAVAGTLQALSGLHLLVHHWDLDVAGVAAAALGLLAWSPWPQAVTVALAVMAPMVAAATTVAVVQAGVRGSEQDRPG